MDKMYAVKENDLKAIGDAIRSKKQTTDLIKIEDMPQEIEDIQGGGDPSEYFNTNPTVEEFPAVSNWVKDYYIKKTGELIIPDTITTLSYLCSDTMLAPKIICGDKITNMESLYAKNTSKSIDVSGLNTSNVTNINNMFYYSSIKKIDISNFDLKKLSTFSSYYGNVFSYCFYLEKVIITPDIIRPLYQWFRGCYSLKVLVIKANTLLTYNATFQNCYHMDGTVNATYNPQGLKDGRIYVPDNLVDSYKSATGWANYGDQILPLSQYVEEN